MVGVKAAIAAAFSQHDFGATGRPVRRRKKSLQMLRGPDPSSSTSSSDDPQAQIRDKLTVASSASGEFVVIPSPLSSYVSVTSDQDLDCQQVVRDAVKRLGGIEKVTYEALLDELMEHSYEGLNLLDVDRELEMLKISTSSEGYEASIDHSGEAADYKWSGILNEGSSQEIASLDERSEKFRARLVDLGLANDDVESQLEAEDSMFRFCTRFFPEDCEFDKDTLIQLWIAGGLIKGEHKDHIGDLYFNILLSDGYVLHTRTCLPEEIHKYKLNVDRLNNHVGSMVHSDDNNEEVNLNKLKNVHHHEAHKEVQHITLVGDESDETNLEKIKSFKDLKALLLICEDNSGIKKIPQNVWSALEHLEVLDLSRTHIMDLPHSIGRLVELRYLDLSSTLIKSLPETIDSLCNLQTLKLKDCEHLYRLPEGMRKLTSLEHLVLDVLSQLAVMPRGMGALTNLVTLSAFLVDKTDGRSIKELKNVDKLKGRFCLSKLENVLSPHEAKEAALSNKKYLKELELRWSDSREPLLLDKKGCKDDEVLRLLCPNSNLEQLQISCYGGSKFPSWISDPSLNMLTHITLLKCEDSELLPSLGKLPSLKFLSLVEMSSVKTIGSEFRGRSNISVAFPKLERLEIIGLVQLEIWKGTKEGDYPHLCKLIIERCPKLSSLPSSLLCLYTLKHLELINCPMFSSLPDKDLSISLSTLIVESCPLIQKRLQSRKGKDWHKIKHVKYVSIDQEEVVDQGYLTGGLKRLTSIKSYIK